MANRSLISAALALGALVVTVGLVLQLGPATDSGSKADIQPTTAGTSPHVVVVMGCTLRRDQLSPWGGPDGLTPWLQEAAEQGTIFTDAISASSWTKESSTALFTGRRAAEVGMIDPGPEHSTRVLDDSVTTLAETLQMRGYWTSGVTANPHLNATYGLAQGFDSYEGTSSTGFSRKDKVDGSEVVDRALHAVDSRPASDAPIYLRLVLIDPHSPIDIHRDEWGPLATDGVSPRLAKYRAGVARVDRALAQLEAGLNARGIRSEDTLFVLITDHGEGLHMPIHHRGQHGRVLYPSLTSVPWLMRGPGVAAGHKVSGLASHEDLLPTVLGVLGAPVPDDLRGFNWSSLVSGAEARTDRRLAFADTWYFGARRGAVWSETQACQADWGSTGIKEDLFEAGCFQRVEDPDWSRVQPLVGDLPSELEAWRQDVWKAYEAWPHTRDAEVRVGDRERQQLKALGYVE